MAKDGEKFLQGDGAIDGQERKGVEKSSSTL